jgi:glycosyltransferase involved in cell wall biosynthesis
MRVLICHNFYQQPGGEDKVFAAEADLLRKFGHDVQTHSIHNDQINSMSHLSLAAKTVWNRAAANEVFAKTREHRAQVVHFHNTFPLFSPAVYSAAKKAGAATVQTLHNYRLICPAATMFRDGKPCEKCLGRLPLPAIRHKCYRQSRAASATAAVSLGIHRFLGTYATEIDAYIALTNFARDKFLAAGFEPDRIHVKPNFPDPDPTPGPGTGNFALFVGRLIEEKGVRSLLQAWHDPNLKIRLKICGDGPLADEVRAASEENPKIEYLGRQPLSGVLDLMRHASALIFPSLWYEAFPRTIVESLACGTPIIASDLGSMKELIAPGRTGALFTPGNAAHLAQTAIDLHANPDALQQMRPHAREEFVTKYNPDRNHRLMLDIYHQALAHRPGIADPELATAT